MFSVFHKFCIKSFPFPCIVSHSLCTPKTIIRTYSFMCHSSNCILPPAVTKPLRTWAEHKCLKLYQLVFHLRLQTPSVLLLNVSNVSLALSQMHSWFKSVFDTILHHTHVAHLTANGLWSRLPGISESTGMNFGISCSHVVCWHSLIVVLEINLVYVLFAKYFSC